jgi:hypothetical protein
MTEPTHPERFSSWPAMLAQLGPDAYDALCITFSALVAGHLDPADLAEFSGEANLAGAMGYDTLEDDDDEQEWTHTVLSGSSSTQSARTDEQEWPPLRLVAGDER